MEPLQRKHDVDILLEAGPVEIHRRMAHHKVLARIACNYTVAGIPQVEPRIVSPMDARGGDQRNTPGRKRRTAEKRLRFETWAFFREQMQRIRLRQVYEANQNSLLLLD